MHPVPSGRPENENMDQDESTLVLQGNRLSHSITLKTDFVAPRAVGQSFYEERDISFMQRFSPSFQRIQRLLPDSSFAFTAGILTAAQSTI